MSRQHQPNSERFIAKVDINPDGCCLWKGSVLNSGYGKYHIYNSETGKFDTVTAHRASYLMFNGSIPEGHVIRHTCDTKLCVNPDHLITGTHQENTADCIQRMRHCYGEKSHLAKLKEADVLAIRANPEHKTQKELAKQYNVSRIQIHMILAGKKWKHLLPAQTESSLSSSSSL